MSQSFDETKFSHIWTFRITGTIAAGLGGLVVRKLLSK